MRRKPKQGFSDDVKLAFPEKETPYLLEDFWYIDHEGDKHIAYAGMLTDGTSIPRALWTIFGNPFSTDHLPAAVIHDCICYDCEDLIRAGLKKEARQLRLSADRLFLEMLLYLKIRKSKARLMYRGVRIGAMFL